LVFGEPPMLVAWARSPACVIVLPKSNRNSELGYLRMENYKMHACTRLPFVSQKACVTATAQICTLSQNGYGARCREPTQ
jgi:hypothetical protein